MSKPTPPAPRLRRHYQPGEVTVHDARLAGLRALLPTAAPTRR